MNWTGHLGSHTKTQRHWLAGLNFRKRPFCDYGPSTEDTTELYDEFRNKVLNLLQKPVFHCCVLWHRHVSDEEKQVWQSLAMHRASSFKHAFAVQTSASTYIFLMNSRHCPLVCRAIPNRGLLSDLFCKQTFSGIVFWRDHLQHWKWRSTLNPLFSTTFGPPQNQTADAWHSQEHIKLSPNRNWTRLGILYKIIFFTAQLPKTPYWLNRYCFTITIWKTSQQRLHRTNDWGFILHIITPVLRAAKKKMSYSP